MIMEALAKGWPGKPCYGPPPEDCAPFIAWGQLWSSLVSIPKALKRGRPFWHVDNGWVKPGHGGPNGRYRFTYRGMSPVLLENAPPSRLPVCIKPWRKQGRHILVALPSEHFGKAIGLDMNGWIAGIQAEVQRFTDRPIVVRPKRSNLGEGLHAQLENCWALVTHSSNIAVDAVLAGVPVFVAPTSPAAPVGNLDLAALEAPKMSEREPWLRSLMAQQFTVAEMTDGTAARMLEAVHEQVDG